MKLRLNKRKIAAWMILIGIFGLPFVLAMWTLFPLVAGAFTVWFFWRGPKWTRTFIKPILLSVLVGFVIWVWYLPRHYPSDAPVEASTLTRVLSNTSKSKPSVENDPLLEQRRILARELAVVKFKIQRITSAIDTLRSADSIATSRHEKNLPDPANLISAVEETRAALSSAKAEDGGSNLLDPAVLSAVAKSLTEDINQIEEKQRDQTLTSEQLVELQNKLPGLLDRHKVDPVWTRLFRLENAVRATLGAKLESPTIFIARYDRSKDELVYEQETTLRFNGSQARSVDLSNFFSTTPSDLREAVTIQQDGTTTWQRVLPNEAVIMLPISANFVTVKRSITQSKASHAILNDQYVVSFRAIDVHWPSSSFPVIVANIRLPENLDRTWPWTVDTGSGSEFKGVELPQYSFIYSTPAGTLADQREPTLVTFKDEKLTPQGLATNSRITMEVLPGWLSDNFIQQNKNYLIVENMVMALIAAAISATAAIFVKVS